MTFANSLDPDPGSKLFDTLMLFLKNFLKKLIFEKSEDKKKHAKLPRRQKVNIAGTDEMSYMYLTDRKCLFLKKK